MYSATKAALINSQANPFHLRTALFHSTPILDRRRRNHWDSVGRSSKGSSKGSNNYYASRSRRLNSEEQLLRNVGDFAEHLFKNWQHDGYNPSSSQGSSWSNPESRSNRGFRGGANNKKGPHTWSRNGFDFCEDDIEIETIFRSAFGGTGNFYWSFINEEPKRTSSGYSHYRTSSWNWEEQYSDEYESSTDSDNSHSDLTSHRTALGLSASGPINLDDVKNAYRVCALKWHPDRHQGSSKVLAEEKFKVCSSAYQSLCDKLALN